MTEEGFRWRTVGTWRRVCPSGSGGGRTSQAEQGQGLGEQHGGRPTGHAMRVPSATCPAMGPDPNGGVYQLPPSS